MAEKKFNKWRDAMIACDYMEWETPQKLFEELNSEFHFVCDICADENNHKCPVYISKEEDALTRSWAFSGNVFCNPPYGSHTKLFVKKAYEESKKIRGRIVMLLPARTDVAWFHDYVWSKAEVRFLRGRLAFEKNGVKTDRAPFASMIVIYG